MTQEPPPNIADHDAPAAIDMHPVTQRIGVGEDPHRPGVLLLTIMQPRATFVVDLEKPAAREIGQRLLALAGGIEIATELPDGFRPNGQHP